MELCLQNSADNGSLTAAVERNIFFYRGIHPRAGKAKGEGVKGKKQKYHLAIQFRHYNKTVILEIYCYSFFYRCILIQYVAL